MTTIAWTGSEVAADTRGVVGDLVQQSPTIKLLERKGVIYCLTGDFGQCLAVVDWLISGASIDEAPQFLDEPGFDILVIEDSDTGHIYSASYHSYPVDPPVTMGTGHHVAIGAIMAGASAYQAVEIACKLDNNSGLPVQRMKVKNAKKDP